MHKIVFLQVDAEDSKRIEEQFPDAIITSSPLSESLDVCKDATVISTFIYSQFDKDILDQLPNLQLLCTRSVGYDHIDLEECAKRGITVCNVPDYGSHVIAEHVFALLLSALRHILEADKRTESGEFDYHGLRGIALQGKTIGIIGTGKIGRHVAQIAHGFDMKIIATDKCRTVELENQFNVTYMSFEELLAQSDIITLHVPALKETEHMINKDAFSHMKDGVILVNTARGSLIDSQALLDALQSGKVAHAMLDVLEHEKNFEENKELIRHASVVTTPHIAFYTESSMQNMYIDCLESIQQWRSGQQPTHIVSPPEVICDLDGITVSS